MGRVIQFDIPEYVNEFFTETYIDDDTGEKITDQVKYRGITLGSGDAWPVYLRIFMISAYLKEQDEENKKIILKMCPIKCQESNSLSNLLSGPASLNALLSYCQPNNDMLNFDYILNHSDKLNKLSLYPFVYLAEQYKHNHRISTKEVREISKMFTELKEYLPYHKEDLKHSPYYEVADELYNLADDRWDDVVNGFKEASEKSEVITHFY